MWFWFFFKYAPENLASFVFRIALLVSILISIIYILELGDSCCTQFGKSQYNDTTIILYFIEIKLLITAVLKKIQQSDVLKCKERRHYLRRGVREINTTSTDSFKKSTGYSVLFCSNTSEAKYWVTFLAQKAVYCCKIAYNRC